MYGREVACNTHGQIRERRGEKKKKDGDDDMEKRKGDDDVEIAAGKNFRSGPEKGFATCANCDKLQV